MLNILFRPLPKEATKEVIEEFSADVGSLEDERVSLSESLTEQVSTVDDAPPKIPLGGIRDRLAKVNKKQFSQRLKIISCFNYYLYGFR